jgi:hypothetical protein
MDQPSGVDHHGRPDWAPADVDMDAASPARVYDALLGGWHNFEVDRQAARWGVEAVPDLPAAAVANRQFLGRAVTHLAESGITQFIDIGAGIPTMGSTHEIAQRCNPECRVAYVDIDAVAIAHASTILAGNDRAIAVRGDLRTPHAVLTDPSLTTFIDLSEPVAVLMVAVVHLLTDEDAAAAAVAAVQDGIAAGSHLVITSLTSSHRPGDVTRLTGVAARDRIWLIPRPRAWIESLFGDFSLVPPGLVQVADWRPQPDPVPTAAVVAEPEGVAGPDGSAAAAGRPEPNEQADRGAALILGAIGRKG